MQKNIHCNLTNTLATLCGLDNAKLIAWANQYTDECTDAETHGVQTAVKINLVGTDGWRTKQMQTTVITAFHFIPGDDPSNPHMTTENCSKARNLVKAAKTPIFRDLAPDVYWATDTLIKLLDREAAALAAGVAGAGAAALVDDGSPVVIPEGGTF